MPDEQEMDEQEMIDELWATYDKDQNARIDKDEYHKFMDDVCRMIGRHISHHDCEKLFKKADNDKSGFLSKDQFTILIKEINKIHPVEGHEHALSAMNEHVIIDELWQTYDLDHNKRIDKTEFKKFMADISDMLGKKMKKHDCEKLFRKADTDHSGYLNKEQFEKLIKDIIV